MKVLCLSEFGKTKRYDSFTISQKIMAIALKLVRSLGDRQPTDIYLLSQFRLL